MFTPSLVSEMLHTLLLGTKPPATSLEFKRTADVADWLAGLLPETVSPEARVPTVVRSRRVGVCAEYLELPSEAVVVESQDGLGYAWARVRLDRLIRYFVEGNKVPADDECLDLAPSLQMAARTAAGASCAGILKSSPVSAAKAALVIIDQGLGAAQGSADTFGGRVNQFPGHGVEMSPHAQEVLDTAVHRLQSRNRLSDVVLGCSLTGVPLKQVGRACFQHAGAVEMLDAVKRADVAMSSASIPVVFNLSMGVHGGPHNGDSPLERYIASLVRPRARFFVCAAGNDGGTGIAATRRLMAGQEESIIVRTGPGGAQDLLVEIWWADSGQNVVDLEVWLERAQGGAPLTVPLKVNSQQALTTLTPHGAGFSGATCATLAHARVVGNMNCIAFALSTPQASDLASLKIRLTLKSQHSIPVNAWLTVNPDPFTSFVEGNQTGTLRVPATAAATVSVAGIQANGQPWADSSRGPAALYWVSQGATAIPTAPKLAVNVDAATGPSAGTSFSSARAAADLAAAVTDPARLARCMTSNDAAGELLGGTKTWDARLGFGLLMP